MRKNIIFILAACILLSGCGLYKKYEQNVETPTDIYGATGYITAPVDSTSMAQLSWREFFTDPLLQNLIDRVLANNTDLNSARLAVEISEESLKTAKAAYLPAISFAPSGTLSSFDFGAVSKTYSVPLQLNMDVELFGGITNKKRAANAALLQSQMREEAVRANLISTVAQQYFLLQVLDRELAILNETDSLWNASLEMEKSLWENGKAFSTAVNQMEASYLNVKTQVVDIRRAIVSVENSICRLLAEPPHHIERGAWGSSALPEHPETTTGQRMFDKKFIKIGVPAKMLELRPDVRLANYAMEEAFYNTQAARAAFFPSLSLQGLVGWTNNAGSVIVNPGKILLNAVASLTQPIYARGKIKANYNIAKYTEEDIRQKYIQTVIDAGNQVNEALADCQAARDKYKYYRRQVEVLHEAYIGTHELMDNGKSDYIEVLTAQESLLSAQLNEVLNMYDGAQAVIELYIALGGATK